MYLVVVGGGLEIGIRGRLIPRQQCTRMCVAVVGGGLVMWTLFLHLVVLG